MHHGRLTARNKYGISVMDRMTETSAVSVDATVSNATVYFQDIAGELRNCYEVAYYLTNDARAGTFCKVLVHSLKVSELEPTIFRDKQMQRTNRTQSTTKEPNFKAS